MRLFTLARALIYATLFVGFVLVYAPARLLSWSGLERPEAIGAPQIAGTVLGGIGAAIALWSVLSFALIGRGTPAPFDPPRRLVVRGPYRYVRNPMYLGAALAMFGASVFYASWPLLGYTLAFLVAAHLFIVGYEEPALRRIFGDPYDDYVRVVRRWRPRLRR